MAEDERNWYVIHTYSGYEQRVQTNLEHRITSMDAQDKIFQVVIPTENEIEIKDGQRRTVARKVFPGYILVEMILNDESWNVVRNTPGKSWKRQYIPRFTLGLWAPGSGSDAPHGTSKPLEIDPLHLDGARSPST